MQGFICEMNYKEKYACILKTLKQKHGQQSVQNWRKNEQLT